MAIYTPNREASAGTNSAHILVSDSQHQNGERIRLCCLGTILGALFG